jgi:hypothetical protein
MPRRKEVFIGVITIAVIFAATAVTLAKLGNSAIAQGEGNLTIRNQTLTPQQEAAICNPNNPKLNFVNTTESRICGIPKTIQNTTASTSNMTTGAPSSLPQPPPPPPPP